MSEGMFVDTSGFYALLVKADEEHARAAAILRSRGEQRKGFVTTDYVLDETATLMKARGHSYLLRAFFDVVFRSAACRVEWTDRKRFERAVRFLLDHEDKPWSFTDCLSFCVMEELGIRQALTKDKHFRQAGFEALPV